MKLLLIATILAAASASPRLGSAKCSWGPAYWCQSYKQAKECQAIQHCREKVWIMKPEDACQDCELVLNELKVILSKNITQHEIVIYLEDLCSKLSGHGSECKALVDVYAPIFIEQIRDFIVDTKKACVSLGLCAVKDKSTIMAAVLRNAIPHKNLVAILEPGPVLMQLKKKPSPDSNKKPASVLMKPVKKSSPLKKSDAGPLCFLCEFLMTELDRLISKNSTEQQIEAALEKVCSILPSTVRQECVEFVDTYAPAILEILLSELNPKMVCTTLGLCKARKVSKPAKKLQLKAQPTCVLCEYVMQELDTILGQNSTEEEIENALEMVCSRLPSTVRSECDQYVKQYTPVIIKLLLDMKPSEICTALGLCKSSKTLKGKKQEGPLSAGISVKCVLCEFVMDKLENLVNQNSTETEIREALDKVCSYMPSTIRAECTDFVNEYTDKIIEFLIEDFTPHKVCTKLGLCTGTKRPATTKVKVKSNLVCTACKVLVNYAKMVLSKNVSEKEVIAEALKLCSLLPDQIKTECTSLVNEYGRLILELILTQTPEQLCKDFKLCNSSLTIVNQKLGGKGETPCFLGAKYWCTDEETAVKCDALQHCKNHVW